jgi:hypothetical protein
MHCIPLHLAPQQHFVVLKPSRLGVKYRGLAQAARDCPPLEWGPKAEGAATCAPGAQASSRAKRMMPRAGSGCLGLGPLRPEWTGPARPAGPGAPSASAWLTRRTLIERNSKQPKSYPMYWWVPTDGSAAVATDQLRLRFRKGTYCPKWEVEASRCSIVAGERAHRGARLGAGLKYSQFWWTSRNVHRHDSSAFVPLCGTQLFESSPVGWS